MARKGAIILIVVGFMMWLAGWITANINASAMWQIASGFSTGRMTDPTGLLWGFYILMPIGMFLVLLGAILLGMSASKKEKKEPLKLKNFRADY